MSISIKKLSLALGLIVCLFGMFATAHAVVRLPHGEFLESTEDLKVKVLGGFVSMTRTWDKGQWHFNPAWNSLKFTYDSLDASVKSIDLVGAEYKRTTPGTYVLDASSFIKVTATGYRWQNKTGNWVDYNAQGVIQTYGDRNDIKVTFQYDATGKRTGVFDHHGNQVLWYEYTADQLTAIRDVTNRRVTYGYTGNNLTTVVDVLNNTWRYAYISPTKLSVITDPENRTLTLTYDGGGRVASAKDRDNIGFTYEYDYDANKREYFVRQRTSSGKITETWYDAQSNVIRKDINGKTFISTNTDTAARTTATTDARGLTTSVTRDQWDNVTKTVYPDGTGTSATYDPQYSNPLTSTDEKGTVTKYEYDAKGNLTKLTEALNLPEQRITEHSYNQYGQRIISRRLADVNTQEIVIRYEYGDSYGNLTAIVDAEGYRTEFGSHDAMGNYRTMVDARQKVWSRTYDNRGRLTSETSPLNNIKRTEYDKSGLRSKTIDPAGNETLFGYDARGNLITVTDPYSGVTRLEYDADNNRTKETDQESRALIAEYDLDGRILKQTDGNGNVTQNIYGDIDSGLDGLLIRTIYPTYSQEFRRDTRGRITEVVDIVDANTRYSTKATYDVTGAITSNIDSEGKIKTYEYDALRRLIRITDPLQGITTYVYDNRNNLIRVQNPRGKSHRFEYDRRNLMIREIRPLGQATVYVFGPTGNLDSVTNAKGQLKRYTYDDAGRRAVETHYATPSATTAEKTITYYYNNLDALISWSNGVESGTTEYDLRQLRRLGETINYGGFNLSYRYGYYANGLKRSFTGPDNVTVDYAYDNNNQLSRVVLPTGSFTINQYRWTAPERITFPGGATRTNTYDPLMRLTNISVKDPGQSELLNYKYLYDRVDNIREKNTEHGNYGYVYDDLHRLTDETNPSPLTREIYTYDSIGNRLTDNSVQGVWSYNDNNQLTNYGNITHTYDDNGNTATETAGTVVKTFIYDLDGRLITVTATDTSTNTTSIVSSYGYDPLGRRLWKEVNNNRTHFLYSQEGLIAEADNIGTLTELYGYKPHAIWGADPVYIKHGPNYYFYQNDHLGTPQKIIASNGTVVWSAKANGFGNTIVDPTSTLVNNLRFAGQYFDSETGNHYNWMRNYDPNIGRYTTPDPLGISAGLNEYLYVDARPTIAMDPRGLTSSSINVSCMYTGKQCKDGKSKIVKENDQSYESDWYCCIIVFDSLTGQGVCNTLRIRLKLMEVQYYHDLYDLYRITPTSNEMECTRTKNNQCTAYDPTKPICVPAPDKRELIEKVDEKWYRTRFHSWFEVDPCPIDGPFDPPGRSRGG